MTVTETPRLSWREERRLDRQAEAGLALDREERLSALRSAEKDADARRRQDARAENRKARTEAATRRAASRRKTAGWVRENPTGLLFVLVIGVPVLMTSAAMAAFGARMDPPFGVLLFLFSEGAMWAFEARAEAVTRQARKDGVTVPVARYRIGAWVCGGFGFALNFLRGVTPSTPGHGLALGLMLGILSVAGLAVFQLIQARPPRARRTRQDRARLAAARDVVRLSLPGRGPSAIRARRGVLRTVRAGLLTPADTMAFSGLLTGTGTAGLHAAALAAALGGDLPALDPAEADQLRTELAGTAEQLHAELADAVTALRDLIESVRKSLRADLAALADSSGSGGKKKPGNGPAIRKLLADDPGMPQKDIAERLGIDVRTVRRHLTTATDTTDTSTGTAPDLA